LNRSPQHELYVALLHYPVLNKRGEIIVSAVTNLDLHEIARAVRTYNAARFYVITPLKDQSRLSHRIVSYWTEGDGAARNPQRAEALKRVTIKDNLGDVRDDIRMSGGCEPVVVVTSARSHEGAVGFSFVRELLAEKNVLLVFGTAWGVEKTVLDEADYVLEPLQGESDYNHLSVRSAVSIMLDRLIRIDI